MLSTEMSVALLTLPNERLGTIYPISSKKWALQRALQILPFCCHP